MQKQYETLQREIVSKRSAVEVRELRAQLGHFSTKTETFQDVQKYVKLLHSCGPVVNGEQDIIKATTKMCLQVLIEQMVKEFNNDVEACLQDLKYGMETLGCADAALSTAMEAVGKHAELLTATNRIKTYPSFEALQDADKDETLCKKLLSSWKACNSKSGGLAAVFQLTEEKSLEKVRSLGWELVEGVCRHKQKALDQKLKSLTEQLATKTAVVAAWKKDLPANAKWEDAVKAAQHLWKTAEAGKALQTTFKNLMQDCALSEGRPKGHLDSKHVLERSC